MPSPGIFKLWNIYAKNDLIKALFIASLNSWWHDEGQRACTEDQSSISCASYARKTLNNRSWKLAATVSSPLIVRGSFPWNYKVKNSEIQLADLQQYSKQTHINSLHGIRNANLIRWVNLKLINSGCLDRKEWLTKDHCHPHQRFLYKMSVYRVKHCIPSSH